MSPFYLVRNSCTSLHNLTFPPVQYCIHFRKCKQFRNRQFIFPVPLNPNWLQYTVQYTPLCLAYFILSGVFVLGTRAGDKSWPQKKHLPLLRRTDGEARSLSCHTAASSLYAAPTESSQLELNLTISMLERKKRIIHFSYVQYLFRLIKLNKSLGPVF